MAGQNHGFRLLGHSEWVPGSLSPLLLGLLLPRIGPWIQSVQELVMKVCRNLREEGEEAVKMVFASCFRKRDNLPDHLLEKEGQEKTPET